MLGIVSKRRLCWIEIVEHIGSRRKLLNRTMFVESFHYTLLSLLGTTCSAPGTTPDPLEARVTRVFNTCAAIDGCKETRDKGF